MNSASLYFLHLDVIFGMDVCQIYKYTVSRKNHFDNKIIGFPLRLQNRFLFTFFIQAFHIVFFFPIFYFFEKYFLLSNSNDILIRRHKRKIRSKILK